MSNSTIGALEIKLMADVALLRRDMNDAKAVVGGAMKDIEQYAGIASKALLGLGTGVTLGTFVNIVQGAIEAKSTLYDMSLQTGVSVEALSGLGKVAKFSNTSLDDVASASNKLSKALFTQNEDSKGAAQALKALGINFDDFKRLAPEQQFVKVAKSMAQFEDGTEKSAAAMLLYGKTGAQLLPFLAELEERGFKVGKQTTESALQAKQYEDNLIALKGAADAWKRELAEALLPTLVGISGAFVDARKEVDKFNLTGEVLKTSVQTLAVLGANVAFVFEGVGRGIGATLAGYDRLAHFDYAGFKTIAQAIKDDDAKALVELNEFEAKVMGVRARISTSGDFQRGDKDVTGVPRRRLGLDDAAGPSKEAKAYAELVQSIMKKINVSQAEYDQQRKLTEAEQLQAKVFEDLDNGVIKATLSGKLFVDGLLQELLAVEKLNGAQAAESKWMESSLADTEKAIGQAGQRAQQMQDAAVSMRQQLADYGLTRAQLDAVASARDRETSAQIRARKVTADLNPALQAMNAALEQQASALEDIATVRDLLSARQKIDAESPLSGADRAIKDYMDEVKRAGDATASAVGNSLHGLEDVLTNFFRTGKLDARSFIDTMIAEFMRLAVVRPLMNSLLGGSGGSLGGLQGLFSQTAAGSSGFGTGLGYGNQDFGGFFAEGGYLAPGKWGIAGERGPEPIFGGRTGVSVKSAGTGSITLAPVIHNHIDSRSDAGQVVALVQQGVAAGNRALVEELRASGRLA